MTRPATMRAGAAQGTPDFGDFGRVPAALAADARRRLAAHTLRSVPGSRKRKAARLALDPSTVSKREHGRIGSPLEDVTAEARRLGPKAASRFASHIIAEVLQPEWEGMDAIAVRQRIRDQHFAETLAQSSLDPIQSTDSLARPVPAEEMRTAVLGHLDELLVLLAGIDRLILLETAGRS